MVIWRRAEERMQWERMQSQREKALVNLDFRSRREWEELYERQRRQQKQLAADGRGIWGRPRRWSQARAIRERCGALRGSQAV